MKTSQQLMKYLSIVLASFAWATTARGQILNPGNGHYYKFVSANIDWTQANSAAAGQQYLGANGYLATITSASEESFILTQFGALFPINYSNTPGPAWIGGFQPAGSPEPGGNWQWVTGESFSYVNWDGANPNNNPSFGGEDVMEIRRDGFWNDTNHDRVGSGYLVEFTPVPEPSTYALLLGGLVTTLVARRRK